MKKLDWEMGDGLSIKILDNKEFIGYGNNGNPQYRRSIKGKLSFIDKRDMVHFGVNIAKGAGLSKEEYKSLVNERIEAVFN